MLFIGIWNKTLFSQSASEAISLAQIANVSSARSASMGGAFNALGGEFSSIHNNPAALGIYRSSEFVFTSGLESAKFQTNYGSTSIPDRTYKFNFRNMGFVGTTLFSNIKGEVRDSGWVALNFSFGYNKTETNNFKTTYSYFNPNNSIIDPIVASLNANGGTHTDALAEQAPFDGNLAWDTYLINPLDTNTQTQYANLIPNGGVQQIQQIQEKAHITNWDFSVGTNYSNKLYLGVNIGLPYYKSKQFKMINESDKYDSIINFKELSYTETVKTNGYGAYVNFGAIWKVTQWLRLGGSAQTPTVFALKDRYSTSMESDLDTFGKGTYSKDSPSGSFEYLMYLPARLNSGVALVLKKRAILSMDVEHIDYSQTFYDFSSNSDNQIDIINSIEENSELKNNYRSINNYRYGIEYRLNDKIALRVGYANYGNPSKNSVSRSKMKEIKSVGFGFRDEGFYMDFAYVISSMNSSYYGTDNSTVNVIEEKRHMLMTVGIRF